MAQDDTKDTHVETHSSLRKRFAIFQTELEDVLGYGILLVIIYLALWLAINAGFGYGGPVWGIVALWTASHLGGILASMMRLPPLLGMIVSGLVLRNAVPQLIAGLPVVWTQQVRAMAVGIIFLRCGLELDLKVFKKVGTSCLRLLLIPGLSEAMCTGLIGGVVIFGMPWQLGLTMGFIITGVGPAIVIQLMSEMQHNRLGTGKGIPSIVAAAASFDDMIAITGYSLFSSLALYADKPIWESIIHGPIDLSLGAAAGLAGAVFCSMTKIWNTGLKRLLVVFFTAMVMLFTLYHFEYKGGGALSTLVLGMLVSIFWDRNIHFFGVPGYLTLLGPGKPGSHEMTHKVEEKIGVFWRFIAQPLLFGIIGTLINFNTLDPSIIPLSLGIICLAVGVRFPVAFTAMTGAANLNWRERIFIACSWLPKATLQAALAAQPLDTIRQKIWGSEAEKERMIRHGEQILTTAVFAVLVCAQLGVLLTSFLARRLLQQEALPVDPMDDTMSISSAPATAERMPSLTDGLNHPPVLIRSSLVGAFNSYLSGSETGFVSTAAAVDAPAPSTSAGPTAAYDVTPLIKSGLQAV